MPDPLARTLAHVLLGRVAADGDRLAYEYLHEDGRVDTLTYRELLDGAAGVVHRLCEDGAADGPALLLYPPGLDFVVALWGCLLAGVPVVPAFAPLVGPADRVMPRLARIVADSRATRLLADDPSVLDLVAASGWQGSLIQVLAQEPTQPVDLAPQALPAPQDVALIQYTSGSTGQPKGVVLEHRNLLANIAAISALFELDASAKAISWLPPYHDMGLIGAILTPVHGAFPIRLMSPAHFLKNPLIWLRQIGEFGVTHTGGPNFAYDLCLRRASGVDLSDVDLSTWRLAFNGAEPIRPRTLTAFAERFAVNGFRPGAFLPCYGLAEATLMVTGRQWSTEDGFDRAGRVNCGPVIAGHDLVVVDPVSGAPVGEHTEGEIWVRGPSVCRGYWNDTGAKEDEEFGDIDGRRHLRTGDLGYMYNGELFVTGRRKDVLIQHGLNYHAHDIELAAVDDNPAVRTTAAAFTVGNDQELVVAIELAKRHVADSAEVATDIRARVLTATGLRVDTVVLCSPGTLPRTTSGKVQRGEARARYLAGELSGQPIFGCPVEFRVQEPLEMLLTGIFAEVCEVAQCAPTQTLSSIGGDSIRAAEIAAVTEEALAMPVPIKIVLDAQSPRELSAWLLGQWAVDGVPESAVLARIGVLTADE